MRNGKAALEILPNVLGGYLVGTSNITCILSRKTVDIDIAELEDHQLHRSHIYLCSCQNLRLPLPPQIPGIALRRVGSLERTVNEQPLGVVSNQLNRRLAT